MLRMATINLFRDRSRWAERRDLLVGELSGLSLDLIAVQEVIDPLGDSSAHWLAENLGGYSVVVSPKTGWERKREGIAVLSRWPVDDWETIDLGSQNRIAQVVTIRFENESRFRLVNGHFFFPVGAHRAQVKQVERVLAAIKRSGRGPVVVCGDFNATPRCRSIDLMRREFRSAFQVRNGREPDFTCPTRLISGGRIRRSVMTNLCRIMPIHTSNLWRGTLDYIFVSPEIRVHECDVILDQPSPSDATLYASDHLGIAATLEIPPTPLP